MLNKLCANREQDVGSAPSAPQRANYQQLSTRGPQFFPYFVETQHPRPKAFLYLSRGPRPPY